MPFEQKRYYASTVASTMSHRKRSRRRIAAVSFLSNISLDGSHRDTNLHHFTTAITRNRGHIIKSCSSNNGVKNNVSQGLDFFNAHNNAPNECLESQSTSNISAPKLTSGKMSSEAESYNFFDKSETKSKYYSLQSPNSEMNVACANASTLEDGVENANYLVILGPLSSNTGLSRSNSKRFTVQSTIEKCGRHVASKVRSLAGKSNLNRNSMNSSVASISAAWLEEDKSKSRVYADKENITPIAEGQVTKPDRPFSSSCKASVVLGAGEKSFSSCESLGAVPSQTVHTRKPSSSKSESGSCSNIKELKYLKLGHIPSAVASGSTDPRTVSIAEYRCCHSVDCEGRTCSVCGPTVCVASVAASVARYASDGRVLLTTGRGPPLYVFSLVKDRMSVQLAGKEPPTVSTLMPGLDHSTGTGTRKRNISGSRHLATIADSTNSEGQYSHSSPLGAAGLMTSKVQDVSYQHLLVASYSASQFKKKQIIEQQKWPFSYGRCVSYDPNLAQSCADYGLLLPQQQTLLGMLSLAAFDQRPLPDSQSWTGGAVHKNTTLSSAKPHSYLFSHEFLDDPEMMAGKHRKLLRFPSYLTSLIDYAKPDELKREINEKFRSKFAHVKITLSKLRSLKREMVRICRQGFSYAITTSCGTASTFPNEWCALLTMAHAHAYFETLCMNGTVEKSSRKPLAGACIMISAKLNDVKGDVLAALVDKIEQQLRVERTDLLSSEFDAFVALQFNLHVPTPLVNMHFQRLMFEH